MTNQYAKQRYANQQRAKKSNDWTYLFGEINKVHLMSQYRVCGGDVI